MPKDLIAELLEANLSDDPLPGLFAAEDTIQKCKITHPPINRLEAVFAVYRGYKEYDYEDWQVAVPSRSLDLSKEVEATLLQAAQQSLTSTQNVAHPTLWTRIKRLLTRSGPKLAY